MLATAADPAARGDAARRSPGRADDSAKGCSRLPIKPGDLLLLIGPDKNIAAASQWLGVLPLENRRLEVMQRTKALLAISIFAAAIALSVAGITSLAIALGLCVVAYLLLGIIGGRDFYALIEWKVIVLLACLIPVGRRAGGDRRQRADRRPDRQSDRRPAGLGAC
jgi:hypothetical protein